MNPTHNSVAFGAPGIEPRWTSSAKEGLGTAYHTSCRVWFTLNHGIVNEIAVIEFTFFWKEAQRSEGRNYSVKVSGPRQEGNR